MTGHHRAQPPPKRGQHVNTRPAFCNTRGAPMVDRTAMPTSRPDSAALHYHDQESDGQPLVAVCCIEHLAMRGEAYASRLLVEQELCAGKIHRALNFGGGKGLRPAQFATATGLTYEQIRRAMRWRNRRIQQLRKDRLP